MMANKITSSSSATRQQPQGIVQASQQNDTSCASSNSGASSGYRHNPYDCKDTLVYYNHSSPAAQQGLSSANSSMHQSPSPQQQYQQVQSQYGQQYPNTAAQQYDDYETHDMQMYNDAQMYDEQFNSFEQRRFQAATPMMTYQPPQGTLHTQLAGRINFALYPTVAFESLEPTVPKHHMVRMFIGQLPYNVTEMQLSWILYTFGAGANMYHFERITKTDHSKGGIKVPTGCFHCHMESEQVAPLLKFLNDRLLVDDTGIWVTETAEERSLLSRYCHGMKVDKTRRFQGRPYGTVVAQVATSTFDPDTFAPARYAGGFRRHL